MSDNSVDVEIFDVSDLPEHAKPISEWLEGIWGRLPVNEYLEAISRGTSWGRPLPRTLVVTAEDKPIGTASLVEYDIETRRDLSPWLACVYVVPGERRKGVAARLEGAIHDLAKELGILQLYLFCEPPLDEYYDKLGWSRLEKSMYHDDPIVIMSKSLVPRRPSFEALSLD
jgi:GNAT superfamily N-acetyltransferase